MPPDIQDFLNSGGWLLVAAVGGVLSLLILWVIVRKLLARRRKPAIAEPSLVEDLATYPPPPALWGERRLTLYGMPVRVRLVVAAPLGYEAGEIAADEIEPLLDRTVPGLGLISRSDKPRIRLWPTQLSHQGFMATFRRDTLVPAKEGEPTRWVLMMGRVLFDRRPMGIGMALLADQDNFLGRITVEHPHQWVEALRVKP